VYSIQAFDRLTPYIEAANLVRASYCITILTLSCLKYLVHRSFLSSQTPKNQADSVGRTTLPESRISWPVGFWAQVKYISSLFSRAKVIPLVFAYTSQMVHTLSSRQTLTVASPQTNRFISSTNPATSNPSLWKCSYSVAIYRMKSIGERGDPCGTLAVSYCFAISSPSNLNRTVRPVKKLRIYLITYIENPFC
jgi:hypothetical protein